MAETLISPGVLARENDQSQITAQPVQAGAAIIGPTVKGQKYIPKLVTSYSEYLANFGSTFISGSDQFSFFTSISAYNYFQNGGASLLVTRVNSGSFTSATSSFVSGSSGSQNIFLLETLGQGTLLNNDDGTYVATTAGAVNGSGTTTGSNNTLLSGSSDNVRWEIANPSINNGVFSVVIRRGDDTKESPTVLETFANVSLDPKASNYIERIIGNQTKEKRGSGTDVYLQTTGSYRNASNYVRVKEVKVKTPDYFNNAGTPKAKYTASIPLAQSGAFGAASGDIFYAGTQARFYDQITATNTQGQNATDYYDAVNLLANRDDFRYNLITAPGLVHSFSTVPAGGYSHATILNTLVSNTENRGDNIVVLDVSGYNSSVAATVTNASSIDSSYAATYWPWLQISEPDTGQLVWVPASTMIPGVYAYNDNAGEAWFAPAGINRGGLGTVQMAERKLTQKNRDSLYVGKVNPIATFPGSGVVVFGQKTLQTKASALDRVNVRRLLITLKNFISQIADTLVFEQNTSATRNQFLSQVNPYLESVQQRQGLYAFKVVMDESNNTADVIDRNQLIGAIYLQPTKTAEFIYLDFNILPTGATFPA